ncbi:YscG family type III secretion system chaperone [Aeromonas sp. L_1B5_3]|uniref:YscG family type III secretion system chaperone n=1 Tax=Aeromonas sp. L_1B5_3 TaxID=1588629 RepID=UPI0005B74793|nr:YscG family type III secretion system chaperone [Aeromonas sp. L_1B5_3]KIQ81939.1 preprotein translocase G [Aeromonas sp. L_1B5_3]
MDRQLKRQLAELAVAGTGHHCHSQAAAIADWLASDPQMSECVTLIRLSSLMNRGDYEGALALGKGCDTPELEPWLALCEWRLTRLDALQSRLALLEQSELSSLQQFAAGMREQIAS